MRFGKCMGSGDTNVILFARPFPESLELPARALVNCCK